MSTAAYHAFAGFYDAALGERTDHARHLRSLIASYHPGARSVLELGCGTGAILDELRTDFEVTGLDISRPMLAIASDKLPGIPLINGDMTSFSVSERFDVVLCVTDGINHLLGYARWEALFDRAQEHLHEGGIFVFDMHTERNLAQLVTRPPFANWFGDGHLAVTDVRNDDDGRVVCDIRVLEHRGNDRYRLYAEEIRLTSFPRKRVEASLRERFARVTAHDRRRARPTPRTEQLHFVCGTTAPGRRSRRYASE